MPTRWSNIRKGAIFGVYNGWLSFISYLVYSVGFIFGVILMSDVNQPTLSLTDVLVVCNDGSVLNTTADVMFRL